MFTGIITDIGVIETVQKSETDARFRIKTSFDMSRFSIGASIACAGCCLTVVDKGDNWFVVDVSGESLSKTGMGNWKEGSRLNLESSLHFGDELGGHLVSGHVDGQATLEDLWPEGESYRMKIRVPDDLAPYIASKGSVALDGVSLTVNEVEGSVFGINIIPHTWKKTTFQDLKKGDNLNVEVDMLARYVARILGKEDHTA